MKSKQQPLLEIKDLYTWFPIKRGILAHTQGYVRAVDGISLQLYPGETLGVVGESGSGKSTLIRTILGLEKPRSGSITLNGQNILNFKGRQANLAFRRSVQVVFQDPLAALNPRHTVLELITEGLLIHKLVQRDEREGIAIQLLHEVGLAPDMLNRYPHAFSGGQRQRICIARALALKPQLLICDEPVSALDLSVRAQMLNLLQDLKEKFQLSYLFITHDIGVVQHIADRLIVMQQGKIVEQGQTETIMNSPKHPYTQTLLAAVPTL